MNMRKRYLSNLGNVNRNVKMCEAIYAQMKSKNDIIYQIKCSFEI